MNAILEQELAKLSHEQRLELLEQLWGSLDVDAVSHPMSDELFQELERRSRQADEHPEQCVGLDEIAKDFRQSPERWPGA